MKLEDIGRVNHLVGELTDIDALISMAERAEVEAFQLFIESQGDTSLKMSAEGAATSHSRGIDVSGEFLAGLKQTALAELRSKREQVLTALTALGVET